MKKKKRSSKNLSISTRITLSTIFGTLIPLAILLVFSVVFLNTMAENMDFSGNSSNTYSVVSQFQWGQTLTNISDDLTVGYSDEDKLETVKAAVLQIEKLGSLVYIEQDGKEFYATSSKEETLKTAKSIVDIDMNNDIHYYSDKGLVLVRHTKDENHSYLIIITNSLYGAANAMEGSPNNSLAQRLWSKTGLIILLITLIFIVSIGGLSFATSSIIIKPIKKLEEGANEIANGNLDYYIDYESTNELGVTVDAFNDMTLRLRDSLNYQQEIEESRKEMIAGIAHDLRTPLTSVKGYVEGLMDGIADTPEKQERYLKTIYKSTNSMERLLDELLTVSKLETGRISLDLQKININDFLEDCVNNMQIAIESRGFEFIYTNNCSSDVCVMLDSDQFERVIRNILSNSVRYSKKDVKGRIEISAQDYKKTVIISISDNGIGVNSKNISKIFDSFYRDDPARSKVSEGSGLGLYVCKQLVELHGGRIWATGKEGKGLTIHISLNIAE